VGVEIVERLVLRGRLRFHLMNLTNSSQSYSSVVPEMIQYEATTAAAAQLGAVYAIGIEQELPHMMFIGDHASSYAP
jgi:hypothetical protein